QLATGGSVYVLLMVAGLYLYWSIAKAISRVPFVEVGKMLRRPDDSPAGNLVCSRIILIVAFMREKLPLSFENRFCADFNILHRLSATVDCTSLKDSDRFFDCLERK
ncbi:hypothetical protein EDB19DRAFT_1622065, partial [Suillus lakei]